MAEGTRADQQQGRVPHWGIRGCHRAARPEVPEVAPGQVCMPSFSMRTFCSSCKDQEKQSWQWEHTIVVLCKGLLCTHWLA